VQSPPVRRIYKIVTPKGQLTSYNAKFQSSDVKRCDRCIIYRAAVEAKGQFVSSGRSEGNENRRWHGTGRVCNLGDNGQTQFCSTHNCSLCSIIRSSFDISLWGKKTGWGRFGKGIYTSSTSSKSNRPLAQRLQIRFEGYPPEQGRGWQRLRDASRSHDSDCSSCWMIP